MGVVDLFIASLMPVLKVLLITALGSFLAIDRFDILGVDARKHLNNVSFIFYNALPLLLFALLTLHSNLVLSMPA